ncbi:uncharacterized protein BDR25DRAFT_396915 [Lindgomyces ingoldianus]|uniref:Uncharacterized protein n=1 Tax=Lindgomyces ingoldianus TaxID=673940 RepID=A0ACB6QAK7_9PLEO|nr:uncharacterized protein BDR25DRAFT_396915 [Lindgomyces ingoldianus]KAF2463959.1 hypothetical protein BDR25DRAFT_396915 [Lindgomyces ingoldianus]
MPSIKWQTFVQEMLDWHHVATTYLACINYGLTGREERSISYTHLNDWNLCYSSAILPKYDIPSFDFDYDLDWPFVDDGGAINWRWWGCYRGLYPPYLGRLWSQMWFPSTVVQEWPLRDGPVHGRVVGDLLDATRFYPPYMWNHNMKLLRLMFHNTEVVELEDPYSKPDFYFRHTLRPRHRRARSEEWYTSENSPCWICHDLKCSTCYPLAQRLWLLLEDYKLEYRDTPSPSTESISSPAPLSPTSYYNSSMQLGAWIGLISTGLRKRHFTDWINKDTTRPEKLRKFVGVWGLELWHHFFEGLDNWVYCYKVNPLTPAGKALVGVVLEQTAATLTHIYPENELTIQTQQTKSNPADSA